MKRYVALGSSMAAGPAIRPRAAGAPRWSGRSARNYPHQLAERLSLDPGPGFIDVTFSGATTAHVLMDPQRGAPPQITALDGSETLVTVTIGGNDVGYVPLLMAAALPDAARRLPLLGVRISELLDRDARDRALADVFDSLCAVGSALRQRAPAARILFVDYLTLLPPRMRPPRRCPRRTPTWAATWLPPWNELRLTPRRQQAVRWSVPARPAGTTTPGRPNLGPLGRRDLVVPLPGRPAPLHPNAAGMRAVAELVLGQL